MDITNNQCPEISHTLMPSVQLQIRIATSLRHPDQCNTSSRDSLPNALLQIFIEGVPEPRHLARELDGQPQVPLSSTALHQSGKTLVDLATGATHIRLKGEVLAREGAKEARRECLPSPEAGAGVGLLLDEGGGSGPGPGPGPPQGRPTVRRRGEYTQSCSEGAIPTTSQRAGRAVAMLRIVGM